MKRLKLVAVAALRLAIMQALVAFLLPNLALARSIKITRVSDLNFGTAVQGDPPKTILPGTIDNADNASFSVSGDANRAYTIVLPTSATLTTGTGGVNRTVTLSNFRSFPAEGAGVLNSAGDSNLLIGATRSSIALSQVAGSYSGSFTITVVY